MLEIRVSSSDDCVRFEIFDNEERTIARSIDYRAIYDLERGLCRLQQLTNDPTVKASISVAKTTTPLTSSMIRGKLTLNTAIPDLDFGQMMLSLKGAVIIDGQNRLRTTTNLPTTLNGFT